MKEINKKHIEFEAYKQAITILDKKSIYAYNKTLMIKNQKLFATNGKELFVSDTEFSDGFYEPITSSGVIFLKKVEKIDYPNVEILLDFQLTKELIIEAKFQTFDACSFASLTGIAIPYERVEMAKKLNLYKITFKIGKSPVCFSSSDNCMKLLVMPFILPDFEIKDI